VGYQKGNSIEFPFFLSPAKVISKRPQ